LGLRPSVAATLVLGFGALVVIAVGAVFLITLGIAEVNTRELLRASARQHVDAVVASVSVTLAPARAQAEFLARLIGSGEIDPRDDGAAADGSPRRPCRSTANIGRGVHSH
jgi:hypothetical protein